MRSENVDGHGGSTDIEDFFGASGNNGVVAFVVFFNEPILVAGAMSGIDLSTGGIVSASAFDIEREAGGGIGDFIIAASRIKVYLKGLIFGAKFFFGKYL